MKKTLSKLFVVLILLTISLLSTGFKKLEDSPNKLYMVYLDGQKLGAIEDKEELLELIDNNQNKIKNQFGVDKVYPPSGLEIVSYISYVEKPKTANYIYKKIEENSSFTIKGYVVSIVPNEGEIKKIYVLDKGIIEPALLQTAKAFISEDKLDDYINDTQIEVTDTGKTIENVYFDEKVTVKQDYISVDNQIITSESDLSKYLLFGTLKKQSEYSVKDGDTIETVAYNNKLSPEELLISNPALSSKNSLLSEGQILNIGLISPLLTVVEESEVIEDIETNFETVYEDNDTLYASQSYVKQEGVKGLNRVTEKILYQNGEIKNLVVSETKQISPTKSKIVVRGTKKSVDYSLSAYPPAASSTDWGWPTTSPYIITSRFGYRWGRLHAGIDISGTGFGSPIYSSTDGVVVSTITECADNGTYGSSCGGGYGNNVIVRTDTGLYVIYAHLKHNLLVSSGQRVYKGQGVGYMGNSGSSTGTHLHFQISSSPTIWEKGSSYDPCQVAFRC